MIAVYTITHPSSGLFYIGCTRNFGQRQSDHLSKLRNGIFLSTRLQEAYNNDPHVVIVPTECSSITEAEDKEYAILLENRNNPLICNTKFIRACGTPVMTAESRAALSQKKTGLKHTPETIAKMSATRTGRSKTPEWSDKISEARRVGVVIDGVAYRSLTEAAAAHGLNSGGVVAYRIKSDNFPTWVAA